MLSQVNSSRYMSENHTLQLTILLEGYIIKLLEVHEMVIFSHMIFGVSIE